MAIAKMKQITLLAEQSRKDQLLKAVQELQKLELFDLSTLEENELLQYYSQETHPKKRSEYEEKLKDVQSTLAYLSQYVPQPGLLKKMKQGRKELTLKELEQQVQHFSSDEVVGEVKALEKQITSLNQKRKELTDAENYLRNWEALDFNPNDLKTFKATTGRLGIVPSGNVLAFKEAIKDVGSAYLEEIFQHRDEAAYLVITPAEHFEDVEKVLKKYQFTNVNYPYASKPDEELKKILASKKALDKNEKDIKDRLRQFKTSITDLELTEEYYYNLVQRENAKVLLMNGTNLFILNGWLEEEQVSSLKSLLTEELGEEHYAIIDDEIKMKDYDAVPVVLKNNALVEPFESVTEMYSLPKYNDIDPTPHMTPFYLVFFGMMSADFGYGLLLWLGSLVALKGLNLDRGARRFIKFFHLLSYAVMVWGLIYGSFLGYTMPIQLLSTTDDVITILLLSVVFGFIQMVYGLFLNGKIKWQQEQRASSYIDGTAWAGILIGIALLVVDMMVYSNPVLRMASYLLIGVNVVGILAISTLASKNKGLGFALGLYNLYGVTGYVGDLVSYTRLMALGVSGGSIALAFNMIVDFLPPIAKFTVGILLFVFLHALNMFLTYLSAYVHTARLQYVEFFGKFYEGGGRALQPLKTLEKNIYLKQEK
ncbi:V-type ATP synthase subunit I [Pisciglobus halotolerans]|uniref:V/A-type H+-transporting ATPase subunit I n=1 Tax=Pisciglobus halotolerans TaxID=745365 RepID=A0A1I3BFV8_9LACT|nr:V-type ATP synthase subunit I [Pisciglobus halotolerans]SFH61152.1 V/A-type H+-transporting ATPase subunit I [Pisciglobus halotolerans]